MTRWRERHHDVCPLIVHVINVPQALRWFFHGQTDYMRDQGLMTHIMSSPGEGLQKFAEAESVSVTAVDITRRISPWQDLMASVRLTRALRRLRPAIVDAHTPKGGLLGMIAATAARVPVRVYHLRGLRLETSTGAQRRLLLECERLACFLAHRVICVSHAVRESAIDLGICTPDKIIVLGNGSGNGVDATHRFNPDRYPPEARRATRAALRIPADAPVIGFVGRVVREKGVAELVAAWRALCAQGADMHLLVVGPFESHDPLPPEVERLMRSDPRIHLTGAVGETADLYSVMDVLALPSYREGFPNVLLEAAALALPVVASRIPGCVDAVRDGETGALVPPRDADALAEAIGEYIRDPDRRQRHGMTARQRVLRDFQQEAIWEALYQEYVRLLRSRGVSGVVAPQASDAPQAIVRPWPVASSRVKRVIDVVGALVGLAVGAPLLLGIALAIRGNMGGPVLFRHARAGQNGRPFAVVKFRTMRGERGLDGRALTDAERVTALGWFLRRTSLDELPQLWNVLLGEMSLVGPRPLEDWYLPLYSQRERLRMVARPGLTGLAQIRGRNLLPWDERLALDARYVEQWSLWLDLRIMLRTVLLLARGSGVTRDPLAEGDLRKLRSVDIALTSVQLPSARRHDPLPPLMERHGNARKEVIGGIRP